MRAMRTSSIPSRAIRRTAASRIRSRALMRRTLLSPRGADDPRAAGPPGACRRVRRRGADPARGDRRARPRPPARGRGRARPARGLDRAAQRRAALAPSTAARAGRHVEWYLVEEQFGRSTNAISWHVPTAYNVLAHGQPGADRPLPAPGAARRGPRRLRGHRGARRAPTRPASPRPPSAPTRGWRIRGEKWFVTFGDVATVYIVMAAALVDGERLPTLFLVDAATPGIEVDRRPAVHPQLPARPPDAAVRRRGPGGRRDRRRRRRRRPAAGVVRRGAARHRRPLRRRDAGGCSRRRSRGRRAASRAARG